jgi:hypothetical protein
LGQSEQEAEALRQKSACDVDGQKKKAHDPNTIGMHEKLEMTGSHVVTLVKFELTILLSQFPA